MASVLGVWETVCASLPFMTTLSDVDYGIFDLNDVTTRLTPPAIPKMLVPKSPSVADPQLLPKA